MKNKLPTIIIILITLILAGVAIFTAIRLYKTGNKPVAPNVPSSKPEAYGGSCSLSFTLISITPTPPTRVTPTPPTRVTPTPPTRVTPTPTRIPSCNTTPCSSDTQCPSNLVCYRPAPQPGGPSNMGACRNPSCLTSADCICGTPTATATATATSTTRSTATATATATATVTPTGVPTATATSRATATPTYLAEVPTTSQPELPDAGTSWPTIFGTIFGIFVILGSLLLAF